MSRRILIIGLIVLLELAGLVFAYQVFTSFECSATGMEAACRFLRSLVARGIVILPALGLFVWLRQASTTRQQDGTPARLLPPLDPITASGRTRSASVSRPILSPAQLWLLIHTFGVLILFQPLLLGTSQDPQSFFEQSIGAWLVGSTLAVTGAALGLAPLRTWREWIAADRYALVLIAGVAFFVPDLASLVEPLWGLQVLTALTFGAVASLLAVTGMDTFVDPESRVIGLEGFYVQVAQQCSGVEGFALTASFVALYAFLFRRNLRLPTYWLVVLPLALVASWALNILRIYALILIGARVSPELAVDGFHSYAGWMLFTVLAVSIIWLAHASPGLRRNQVLAGGPSLREDWLAARVLPFACFLATGVVGAALAPDPELATPYRALVLGVVLIFFSKHYRTLPGSGDWRAVAVGVMVGLLWVATAPDPPNGGIVADTLAQLGSVAFVSWVLLRVVGTVLLVPLTEELFFRGYLLGRLDFGGMYGRIFAILSSSALFALLHGRWLEAWVAGVVFALAMLRSGRLSDAIAAHIAANAVIAAWAFIQGDWAMI